MNGMGGTNRVSRILGTGCMVFGSLLIAAAMGLFIRNIRQARAAEESALAALAAVKAVISEKRSASGNEWEVEEDIKETVYDKKDFSHDAEAIAVNPEVNEYMGYVRIPVLELELPVLSSWSYPRLKIAPCRYYGSVNANNLVIAAHNYPRHFGMLSKLEPGDEVIFVDMEGKEQNYEVAAVEVLSPESVEEMTAAGYALTMFTCTYGGSNRVTVRCN